MKNHNFSTPIIKLIHSFIQRKSFQIKIKDTLLSIRQIGAGVPQGSPISPLLYNTYTADIPENRRTDLYIYADDTANSSSSVNIQTLKNNIIAHYEELKICYQKWKIHINLEKTQLICITRKRQLPQHPLILDNVEINWTNRLKYLEIIFDTSLTWKQHIQNTRNKATQTVHKLIPVLGKRSKLSTENKLLIYMSHLKPILTCGTTTWGLAAKTHMQEQQVAQNKGIKICTNLPKFVKNFLLHLDLSLPFISKIINKDKEYLL